MYRIYLRTRYKLIKCSNVLKELTQNSFGFRLKRLLLNGIETNYISVVNKNSYNWI